LFAVGAAEAHRAVDREMYLLRLEAYDRQAYEGASR